MRRRRCVELPRLRALIRQIWEGNGGRRAALGGFARFLAFAAAGFAASFVLAPVWRSRGRILRSFGAGEGGGGGRRRAGEWAVGRLGCTGLFDIGLVRLENFFGFGYCSILFVFSNYYLIID